MNLLGSRTLLVLLAAFAVLATLAAGFTLVRPPAPGRFAIRGSLTERLWPGEARRLDLGLRNPNPFVLLVDRITVRMALDEAHREAGCSATRDFAVHQIPRREYPIPVPPRSTATLAWIGVQALPTIRMRDRGAAQNHCRGARLRLTYRGSAGR